MTTFTLAASAASRSERALLLAAYHADQGAQEELVRRYEPLVQATLRRMKLPARSDRDDLAQEARLALLNAIRAWRPGEGAFPALAQRCVLNHLIMKLDAAGRHKHRVLDHALSLNAPLGSDGELTLLERLPAHTADPERCAIVNAQLAAIRDALPSLSERERSAIQGALNGHSQKDLAARQHTTPKAIHLNEARGRRKLARHPLFATA